MRRHLWKIDGSQKLNTQLFRLIALAGLTLCFVLGILRAEADDPTGELIERLEQIGSLQGEFEQQQRDREGKLLATSSGSFQLLRPGYFAWTISSPDRQLIVTDQQYLWHFDRDLETVTRRPVASRALSSPLMVLGGDTALLRQLYEVERAGQGVYLLRVLEGDPGFSELTVKFQQETLHSLSLINQLDQRLQIVFTEVDSDPGLSPADFIFTPPPEADLFYYDE